MASKVQQHQNAKDNLDGSTEMVFATCSQGIKPILFRNPTFENELHVKSAFQALLWTCSRGPWDYEPLKSFIGVLAWIPDSEVLMGEKCWF